MTSTGTRALYMSLPMPCMAISVWCLKNDIFFFLSKSGETDELLNLIPYVRNKGAQVVSVVSNPKSRLAKAPDYFVSLPVEKELCPFNLAPTISTQVQMIFGDVLAIALMNHKKFSLDEYAMNHPAGTIGKRILVKVDDLMLKGEQVPLCAPEDKLINTLVELSNKRAGCVLVVDRDSKLLGIFTDGDLRRALQHFGADVLQREMGTLMTVGGRTISQGSLAWDAMKVMEGNQKSPIMVLPVINQERHVVGLIKMHDILQSGL